MAIATKQLSTHQKTCYDHNFYAWTQQQSHLLRIEQLQLIDIQNLAEEIEDMGRAEKHELESRLEILLMHLLKWQFQPSHRSRSWQLTIKGCGCKDISSKILALRQLFLTFVRRCIS